jgi:predicted RNase H-like HicB family nuclease
MSDERAYRVVVRFEKEREQFLARVPELDASGSGATRAEAIAQVEQAIESRLQAAADGASVPQPVDALAAAPALTLQLSAGTYRDLAYLASHDNMTVEALAAELISRGIGFREGARGGARGPRQGGAPSPQGQASQRPQRDEDAQPAIDPAQRPAAPRGNDRGGNDRGGNDRGPRRGRSGEGYRPELDDKANFLEYLRGLEKGGGGAGGGGGGGGGGPGGGGRNRGRR